jgi:NADPH-dependent glutamate synthase beta subunit-like oxidoreductase/ferredoxin
MIAAADPPPVAGEISMGPPAPCRAGCPVGTDASAYVALIAEGRFAEAYDVARAPNPFASVCGRICAAPCERACRRGRVDRPIAIRALKRVLTEAHGVEARAARWARGLGAVPPARGPSVGIVGAGPAGLSAAHDLRLAGHPVTLYEAAPEPGGMLVQGVPPFRLPRSLLALEIEAIVGLDGVTLRTGCELGRDLDLGALLEAHAAVLVSVGCRQGRLLETPGVGLPGVMRAVDFLRRAHAATADPVEGPVVVVGGGSVAFDAARSAWRLHAEAGGDGQTLLDAARTAIRSGVRGAEGAPVRLVAPEGRDELSVPAEELREAEREGIRVHGRRGVRRIVGEDRVEGVEVSPVRSLFDEAGHFAPELDAARTEILPARSVVLAIGQTADLSFLSDVSEVTTKGRLDADRWGRTAHPRIFAAGDVATGPRDLIEAVAFGQRAAAAVAHRLAGGEGPPPAPRAIRTPEAPRAPPLEDPTRFWSGYDAVPRAELPKLPARARSGAEEVEGALPAEAARTEAFRCLRCDEHLQLSAPRCIACGLCVDVCPSGCLALVPDAEAGEAARLLIDDDACIRCRLCVHRCPADALAFALAPA